MNCRSDEFRLGVGGCLQAAEAGVFVAEGLWGAGVVFSKSQ